MLFDLQRLVVMLN